MNAEYIVKYPINDNSNIKACGECGHTAEDFSFCPKCRTSGHIHPMRTLNQLEWSKNLWKFYSLDSGVKRVEDAIKNLLIKQNEIL